MALLRTVVEGLGPAAGLLARQLDLASALLLLNMGRPANSSNSNRTATSTAPNSNRTTTEGLGAGSRLAPDWIILPDRRSSIGSDRGLRILEADTLTRVLSTTADCPSIGSDMIVGSPE